MWLSSTFAKGGVSLLMGAVGVGVGWYGSTWSSAQAQQHPQPTLSNDVAATPIREADITKRLVTQDFFATGHTNFAFGTASRYYFATRTESANWQYRFYGSKYSIISQQLNGQCKRPYYCTMTPHDDQLITYKDLDTDKLGWTWYVNAERHAQAPNYVSLQRWFGRNALKDEASILKTFVVFGPGASVFARTADSCFWQDLPRPLDTALEDKKREFTETDASEADQNQWIPRLVALGARSSYVAIWEDGSFLYSLPPESGLLEYFQGESTLPASVWENIVLSPHHPMRYFCATKLGHIYWSVPPDNDNQGIPFDISRQADVYMQMRAKEDKRVFSMSQTINSKTVSVVITPETDWDEDSLRRAFKPDSKQEKSTYWFQRFLSR